MPLCTPELCCLTAGTGRGWIVSTASIPAEAKRALQSTDLRLDFTAESGVCNLGSPASKCTREADTFADVLKAVLLFIHAAGLVQPGCNRNIA